MVRGWSVLHRSHLLIDARSTLLAAWESKLHFDRDGEPLRPRFTDHLIMRRAHALTLLKKGEVSMLGMTRWTPWTELAGVHRDLDSLFNRMFGETVRPQSVDVFTPAANVWR